MSAPVRIGILGTGNVAARAMIAPSRDVPDVAIVAVASRDAAKAAAYAAANSIPRHRDYEGLLADPGVDVVYITLPNALHAEWSIRALEAGKHVLCEKPMTCNEREARDVASAAERTGRVFMEALHFPYHPFTKRLRDVLDTRVLGSIVGASVDFQLPASFIPPDDPKRDFALGGGALMDAGCYPLVALRHLVGEVDVVRDASAEIEPANPQVDLRVRGALGLAGGCDCDFQVSFLAERGPVVDLVLTGTQGRMVVKLLVLPHMGATMRLEWRDRVYEERADSTPSYVFQLRELVRCVRDGAPVLTSADDGARTLRVVDEIYRKAGLQPRGI
jgi:predicted dehydrogenase